MAQDTVTRPLFGGNITADIAKEWLDASDLRQVPDNQEVLLSPSNDLTIITEVLESVKEGDAATDLEAAIRYHFASLAHDNDASASEVEQIFALPGTSPGQPALAAESAPTASTPTPAPLLLVGRQTVKKFGQDRGNDGGDQVRIYLALWRLKPAKDVDLVMSLNQPMDRAAVANAEQAAQEDGSISSLAQQTFLRAAGSLKIEDWSLFV